MNYEEIKGKVLELIKGSGLTDTEINLLAKELEILALKSINKHEKIEIIIADFFDKISSRLGTEK